MQTCIPFAGFYESIHSENIDYAERMIFSDDRGDTQPIAACVYESNRKYQDNEPNWRQVHFCYAKDFAETFARENKIQLTFNSVDSPREYNFTTDRIICNIELSEVERLYAAVVPQFMDDVCTQRHTSRSGFISYHSPDWREWGPLADWSMVQVESLIIASIAGSEDWSEQEYADRMNENGQVEDCIYTAATPGFLRLLRISDYLRTRAERAK